MNKHVHLNRSLHGESQTYNDSSGQSLTSKRRSGIVLCEEFRLIERSEAQINGAWRGAHILLFFLAFIFGSFCTFCFHMLTYIFDDKCVLFPKLLSDKSDRHTSVQEIMPIKDKNKTLRVEFVNAQWMDHSVCYLPIYVPLVSGIFGLVWITMFLMCSAGTRTHAGLHSPWRVLFPVFLFSIAMSILCVHTSSVTQSGLQAFCDTLSEITNGSPCSYTVNVVSLAYHRRIRGVYQATQLTIISAWFHTICWLCSVALVLVRVCLAVDFQLVRVRAELNVDIDLMLQRNEKQVRTISPESEENVALKEQQSPSHVYPQNPRVIISAMGSAITEKQSESDATLKEAKNSLEKSLTSPKSKLSNNKSLPQTPPAKSPEIISTEDVDNIAATTKTPKISSSFTTPLFIHSSVPSLSESEDRIITLRKIADKEPKEVIPGSVKDGEVSRSKGPTTVPRSPQSEKDDEATQFKESNTSSGNDSEVIISKQPVTVPEKAGEAKEPERVIALEKDGVAIPQARRWSVTRTRRLKNDKDDEASQSKEAITGPEKEEEPRNQGK